MGKNGNIQVVSCKSKGGKRGQNQAVRRQRRAHKREREKKQATVALTFTSQAAGVFIQFQNDSDSCRLQARVSKKGEKVNKKKEKLESCWLHMVRHHMQMIGDQLGRQK